MRFCHLTHLPHEWQQWRHLCLPTWQFFNKRAQCVFGITGTLQSYRHPLITRKHMHLVKWLKTTDDARPSSKLWAHGCLNKPKSRNSDVGIALLKMMHSLSNIHNQNCKNTYWAIIFTRGQTSKALNITLLSKKVTTININTYYSSKLCISRKPWQYLVLYFQLSPCTINFTSVSPRESLHTSQAARVTSGYGTLGYVVLGGCSWINLL